VVAKEKKKYSISPLHLYPDIAILDGYLPLSTSLELSITTVLDALSHSFEAIWNKNANVRSTEYAIEAICLILENVESLKEDPKNIGIRKILLKASNLAGLAFSNTKTAAAHSISYPLTASFGIPHGIASSMSILPILHINKSKIENELNQILMKLNLYELSNLDERIKKIPESVIKHNIRDWGVQISHLDELVSQSFTKGRMDNNIVDLSKKDVYHILQSIYQHI